MKVLRYIIVFIAVAILLLTLSPVRAQDAGHILFVPLAFDGLEPTPDTDLGTTTETQAEFERAVLDAINAVRAEHDLPALIINPNLSQAAQSHSVDMAQNGCFSHTGCLDGSSVGDRETASGYTWCRCGEIIAAGYMDADAVVEAWMNSDGHRAIILNTAYVDFGAGWAYESGSLYGTYWTIDFGTPL